MGDYTSYREQEAPFNMAIATLKRLDLILLHIRMLDSNETIDSANKQKMYIGYVKQFFLNSVPLLEDEDTEKYKDEVLELNLSVANKIKSGTQKTSYVYDHEKEKRMNEILIELQQKLKKFFMPKGKDPSRAVANF